MINQSHKLSGPFLIDLKNRFRQIAGSDNKIDRKEFENGLLAEAHTAIMKNMDNNAIIEGSKGKIIVHNPWMPGKDGGPYHSTISIIKDDKEEIKNFKGPEHLFFFEAELSSQSILKEKLQVPHPGMTWEDTLSNLKVLDLWRQKINYSLEQDK